MPPVSPPEPRPSVVAGIQHDIREFIRAEQLQPGDRLPPERQLAAQLGVSRTSLRQGLTALRVEGLIEVRHGHGMHLLRSVDDIVPPIPADVLEAHPDLAEAGEVRNALEALAAKLAAERRDADDIEAMVAGIREMDAEIRRGEPGLAGDRTFHQAVLAAARNPVLARLLDAVADHSGRIAQASLSRTGQPARSLSAHRLIFEAITARDAEQARQLMDEHLEITGQISGDEGKGRR
jgi:GntR family transcriptional regulator, transcriptional repressor for pyruvate dehydrogenase complex